MELLDIFEEVLSLTALERQRLLILIQKTFNVPISIYTNKLTSTKFSAIDHLVKSDAVERLGIDKKPIKKRKSRKALRRSREKRFLVADIRTHGIPAKYPQPAVGQQWFNPIPSVRRNFVIKGILNNKAVINYPKTKRLRVKNASVKLSRFADGYTGQLTEKDLKDPKRRVYKYLYTNG